MPYRSEGIEKFCIHTVSKINTHLCLQIIHEQQLDLLWLQRRGSTFITFLCKLRSVWVWILINVELTTTDCLHSHFCSYS